VALKKAFSIIIFIRFNKRLKIKNISSSFSFHEHYTDPTLSSEDEEEANDILPLHPPEDLLPLEEIPLPAPDLVKLPPLEPLLMTLPEVRRPTTPVTTTSTLPPTTTPKTVRAQRSALGGSTRWDTRHAPPLRSPVDAPARIVHAIRVSNPRWLNATYRRDTRIVVREPPETRPYWPGRIKLPRASRNPSTHYQ
jgi:hypothetical protein